MTKFEAGHLYQIQAQSTEPKWFLQDLYNKN